MTSHKRSSRREFLWLAGGVVLGFLGGGIAGYLSKQGESEIVTKTLTETVFSTRTLTQTETLTATETITQTRTVTITKTEKPEIDVEVKVAKGYNAAAKDYEIELKVKASEPLDDIKAYYENASVSGVLDKWKRNRLEYTSSFLTGREIGEQKIRLEVEKDGARAEKEFSINIALSENEIASSSLNRNDLKLLWKDLLKDTELQLDREGLFRKEYELVEKVGLKNVEKTASLFLKQLSNYLLSNQKSYEDISNGLSVILSLLPSKPWIYNGNKVEEVMKAEFPMSGETSYLLAKFLSEMDVGKEYVYAARAMIDQMLTIANWLRVDSFKVLEYEGKKLQLWDLAKQLFQKHLEFEQAGKRASVADEVLLKRWSDRSEVNKNKHIYYGLRQCLLGVHLFITDPVNRTYAWEHDEEFLIRKVQPNGWTPDLIPYANKGLNILLKWIENYEKISEEINYVVKHPEKKYQQKCTDAYWSIIDLIKFPFEESRSWHNTFFPTVTQTYKQDIYETLFKNGSNESRIPVFLKIWGVITFDSPKFLEEVRVELASCYGSLMGYPMYREGFTYPPEKLRGAIHG